MKKNNKKGVRAYSLGGILLIVLIIALFACGALSVSLPKCADVGGTVSSVRTADSTKSPVFDGENITSETETFKYLFIPLRGITGYSARDDDKARDKLLVNIRSGAFNRVSCNVTFFALLEGVTGSSGHALIVSGVVRTSVPARVWLSREFRFESDVHINVRESYYAALLEQKENLCNMKITLYANGAALPLQSDDAFLFPKDTFSVGGIEPISTTENIPSYDDNGGEDINTEQELTWLRKLYNWCVSKWGWTMSYNLFKVLFCGAIVVIGLLILGVIFGGQKIKVIK